MNASASAGASAAFAFGGRGPRPATLHSSAERPGEWTIEIASLRRTDGKVQRAPLPLPVRHAAWSEAVKQLQRLAQARSAAQLHRDTVASAFERSEMISSRATRCTNYGLGACLVGCLVLFVIVNAVDDGGESGGDPGSDAVMTGAGVAAYLMVATALGLLCLMGSTHVRARFQRQNADRAATRLNELTREFDDQEFRVLNSERELRIGYARSALGEALVPDVIATLITDYLEAPQGPMAHVDAGLRRHDNPHAPAPAEATRPAGQSLEGTQDPP